MCALTVSSARLHFGADRVAISVWEPLLIAAAVSGAWAFMFYQANRASVSLLRAESLILAGSPMFLIPNIVLLHLGWSTAYPDQVSVWYLVLAVGIVLAWFAMLSGGLTRLSRTSHSWQSVFEAGPRIANTHVRLFDMVNIGLVVIEIAALAILSR